MDYINVHTNLFWKFVIVYIINAFENNLKHAKYRGSFDKLKCILSAYS